MSFSRFSSSESVATFALLAKNFRNRQWLVGNRYRDGCIERINSDCPDRTTNRIAKLSLKKYIAASAPLHCIDGWSFLGKALLSCSLGDNNSAKHFAYYAELRAAMSLLASEGIGIFDKKHFTMDNLGLHGPITKEGGTHIAVKKAFEQWSQSTSSGALIEEIIRPAGVSLKDWFSVITSSAGSMSISRLAKDWLNLWGYDLTTLSVDQDIRNEASYRPTGLKSMLSMNARFVSKFVIDMWTLLTPTINRSYYLDLLLLKKAVDDHFAPLPSGIARRGLSRVSIRQVIGSFSFSTTEATSLEKILLGSIRGINGNQLLKLASSQTKDHDRYRYHFFMLARAALLLRLATGACARMAVEARINKEDLKFWWMPLGVSFGFWKKEEQDPLFVMWKDVEQALNNVKDKVPDTMQMEGWRTEYSEDILTLSGCERIGLSGICL